MQLYFIRHGQSTNNALYAATGGEAGRSHDPVLTEVGRRQAEHLAEALAHADPEASGAPYDSQNRRGFGLTHLYCSLMQRAIATGVPVAQRLGLPLHAWMDWHEEGGLYLEDPATGEKVGQPGMTRAEMAEQFPALVVPDTLGEHGWWHGRGFEPHEERPARARRVLAELLERHGGTEDRVAVISHGGFFNHFLCAVAGLNSRPPLFYVMNNCAITRFDFTPHETFVMYVNRADHLPSDLITA